MALLQVKDLHTQFMTKHGTVRAVDGVTFALEHGETVGLVGESGCGKSVTALSVMRLLEAPAAQIVQGEVLFEGEDVLLMTDSRVRAIRGNSIAMVFQDPMSSLNPVLTIGDQITEAMELHLGLDRRSARSRAVELLTMAGIPGAETRLGDYPHQFSGGMRQRVMIAMAISCNPKLILADEITTALDVTIQAQILELLKDLASKLRTGFILITHDLGIVAGMTQRVHVMYAGQIVESADTAELFANPRMPYTWGLLRSVPRLDRERTETLTPIEGLPPDLISPPPGCRFEPRCPFRREICRMQNPDLLQAPDAQGIHTTRCWGTQAVPDGGWLIGTEWEGATGDPETVEAIRQTWRQARARKVGVGGKRSPPI